MYDSFPCLIMAKAKGLILLPFSCWYDNFVLTSELASPAVLQKGFLELTHHSKKA